MQIYVIPVYQNKLRYVHYSTIAWLIFRALKKNSMYIYFGHSVEGKHEREFVSSIERNYYRFTLRPREFLAGLSFTF